MAILSRIKAHGGDVIQDGYRFRLRNGRLSPDAIAWIRRNWRKVCAEVWPLLPDWEERAAIREFEGHQPREVAEREAYREVMDRHV
ncbi:hypothetical protein RAZWK3B_14863 [Roseobacter sp. AzwK-3b]|nr:hypothetical protein RAZWK3B_14863 [Roseobacter sp. AzwK-3b]